MPSGLATLWFVSPRSTGDSMQDRQANVRSRPIGALSACVRYGAAVALLSLMSLPSVQAAKRMGKPPSAVVEWTLPWQQGRRVQYDVTSELVMSMGAAESRYQRSAVTSIVIVAADADGYRQRWTGSAGTSEYDNMPEPMQQVTSALTENLADLPLDVQLDANGNFRAIDNMDDIQPRFAAAMDTWIRATLAKGATLTPEFRSGIDNVSRLATSAKMLESQLGGLPVAYNFLGNGGVGLDHEYSYRDQIGNPAGGEAYPAVGRMTLRKDALQPGWYMLDWTLTMDREAGGRIASESATQVLGKDFVRAGGKEVDEALAALRSGIDVGTSTRIRIDPSTGLVQWLQLVEYKRLGSRNQVTTTTMTLRK